MGRRQHRRAGHAGPPRRTRLARGALARHPAGDPRLPDPAGRPPPVPLPPGRRDRGRGPAVLPGAAGPDGLVRVVPSALLPLRHPLGRRAEARDHAPHHLLPLVGPGVVRLRRREQEPAGRLRQRGGEDEGAGEEQEQLPRRVVPRHPRGPREPGGPELPLPHVREVREGRASQRAPGSAQSLPGGAARVGPGDVRAVPLLRRELQPLAPGDEPHLRPGHRLRGLQFLPRFGTQDGGLQGLRRRGPRLPLPGKPSRGPLVAQEAGGVPAARARERRVPRAARAHAGGREDSGSEREAPGDDRHSEHAQPVRGALVHGGAAPGTAAPGAEPLHGPRGDALPALAGLGLCRCRQ
mmetsp:Transcript_41635/g.120600  ORF Transcript_41635/g.120600 Transcript_41635/m.120600 type:complete len:352 (-) Transcript_41635:596-1651(-)